MWASAFLGFYMHGFFLGLALPFAIFFALNHKMSFWQMGRGFLRRRPAHFLAGIFGSCVCVCRRYGVLGFPEEGECKKALYRDMLCHNRLSDSQPGD